MIDEAKAAIEVECKLKNNNIPRKRSFSDTMITPKISEAFENSTKYPNEQVKYIKNQFGYISIKSNSNDMDDFY